MQWNIFVLTQNCTMTLSYSWVLSHDEGCQGTKSPPGTRNCDIKKKSCDMCQNFQFERNFLFCSSIIFFLVQKNRKSLKRIKILWKCQIKVEKKHDLTHNFLWMTAYVISMLVHTSYVLYFEYIFWKVIVHIQSVYWCLYFLYNFQRFK